MILLVDVSHAANKYVMDTAQSLSDFVHIVEASTRPAKLETTPLPYGVKDLDPVMSKETLDYHFEHLAKGYAKRYNSRRRKCRF